MLLKFVFLFNFCYFVLADSESQLNLENASPLQLFKTARGLGDFFTQLESSLLRTYEEEKMSVYSAVELVKSSGAALAKNAEDIRGISVALSTSLTKLTNEIFAKDKIMVRDQVMENNRRSIELRLRNSVQTMMAASDKIVTVGQKLNKAGAHLENIIPRYGLLDKVEENNVHLAIKSQMDGVKDTLRDSIILLKEAINEITASTKNSARAIIDTALILPKFAYFLYDVDEKNMDVQLQGTFDNFKTLIRDTIEYMSVSASKVTKSGEGLSQAGWSLGVSVPKFGISLLSEQKEIFDRNVIQIFKDLKETFVDIADLFKIAGQKFYETGKFADESTEAFKIAVPKVGKLFFEKKVTHVKNDNYLYQYE